jgi:hypothetical protein
MDGERCHTQSELSEIAELQDCRIAERIEKRERRNTEGDIRQETSRKLG